MVALALLVDLAPAASEGGFNPFHPAAGAAFWTWVIFLLSLPVMWKFVFGPITKGLSARDEQVVQAARSAEEAKKEAERAAQNAHAQLEQARSEGKRMVQEAVTRAERQAQEAQKAAKVEAERQLQKAREDIEAEKRRALLEIRQEVVDLAISSAGRILQRELDDEAHRTMVSGFLKDLEKRSN